MATDPSVTRWLTVTATALTLSAVALPPAAWFFLSYQRAAGAIEAEAELTSWAVTQVVSADPDLWEFESTRLGEQLSSRPRRGVDERRRILNARGEVVAESSDPLPLPLMTRSAPLLDAGVRVGTVEVARSLSPLLARAAALLVVLIPFAVLVFHFLRTVPLRALRLSGTALQRQRAAAQQYLDVAGVAFVVLDDEGRARSVNRKGEEILGRGAADVLGRDWMATFVEGSDRKRVLAELAAARPGDIVSVEFPVSRPSGERRIVNWYATALADDGGGRHGLLLSGVDITRQRQLEEQVGQTQKLRAIGQLAGGVAHDFNGLLASIKKHAAVLRSDLELGNPHRLDAEEILIAVDRAASLTRSLLTFSRRQDRGTELVDLVELVRRSQRLLRRQLREEIDLEIELPAEPLPVMADPGQLEQVLVNLVSNSQDAIRGAGRIVVSAASTRLDAEAATRAGLPAPGAYAQVSVSDDGAGMEPEERARVFEPFFTTKEIGEGTGLGLAVVFGIIEQHRGAIRIASETARGTTVTFLVPQRGSGLARG